MRNFLLGSVIGMEYIQPEPQIPVFAAPPMQRPGAPIYRIHPMGAFVAYPQQAFAFPPPRGAIPPPTIPPHAVHQQTQPPVVVNTKSFRRTAVPNFTPADDATIQHLIELHGCNWTVIQSSMPQFTETQLRDRWKALTENSSLPVSADSGARSKVAAIHPQPQVHMSHVQRPGVVATVVRAKPPVFMDIPETINTQANKSPDWTFQALRNDPKLARVQSLRELTEAAAIADWRHERVMAAMDVGENIITWQRRTW